MIPGCEDHALAVERDARPAPPEDVFHYPLVDLWRPQIWRMLSEVATADVVAAFKADPPEFVVSDDLGWLEGVIFEVTGRELDVRQFLVERFVRQYRAFRAGHATRIDNLTPFYTQGLRRLRAAEVEARTRALFLGGRFPHATEEGLQAAVVDVNPAAGRDGVLFFCADEQNLIARWGLSGHYLVYGSEYLYCLGMRLVGADETKRLLKSIGRPTLFLCDIPMSMMRRDTLYEYAGKIIAYLFSEVREDDEDPPSLGMSGFRILHDLPPEHIVGHFHPVSVYDPKARD